MVSPGSAWPLPLLAVAVSAAAIVAVNVPGGRRGCGAAIEAGIRGIGSVEACACGAGACCTGASATAAAAGCLTKRESSSALSALFAFGFVGAAFAA